MQGELINAAKNRDETACRELFNLWFPRAYQVSRAICGNRSAAEDAVQEALLRFWKALPGLREPELAERYFLRIVVNEARRLCRKRKAIKETELQEGNGPGMLSAGAAEDRELAELLQKAVRALPEKLKSAIEVRYYGGFTEAETAEMLGVSLPSVKMRLVRGRKKLRQSLERDGYDVIGG